MLKRLAMTADAVLNAPLNRGHRWAAVGRYLAWQIRTRVLGGDVIVPFVNGTRLRVRRGMVGATGNIYCGLHEFEEMGFALHLLRPGDVFIDVGANVGSYSMLAAAVGARAFAFEPGERFADLEAQFALNAAAGEAFRLAVGARPGAIRFTRDRDSVNRPALPGEDSVDVEVVTLDAMVPRRIPPPSLIKIDVEGYESAVIAGARRLLADAGLLAVIMETGQGERFGFDEAQLDRDMRAWGFEPVGYDPFTRELRPGSGGSNAIYVRPGVAERLAAAPPFQVRGRLI